MIKKNSLVAVIITSKNEQDVIGRLLKSVQKQTYPQIEVLVIDNNSQDKTAIIAKKYTKLIYNQGPERSAQRNFGAKKSKGRYLLFLDADMELSPRVVEECLVTIQENKKIGALTIPEESISKSFWERVKGFERSFYNLEGDEITDAARFFDRQVFEKTGGYDEAITGPEDWELTESVKRSKYEIGRIKALIYHYERVPSLHSLLKKKYYYGLKSSVYLKKRKMPLVSPKTIYFLRPVFYRHWPRLVLHPVLTLAMFYMLTLEMVAGGLGYLRGKK